MSNHVGRFLEASGGIIVGSSTPHVRRSVGLGQWDLAIAIGFLVLGVFIFKPAIKNFQVVLKDKSNTRATPSVRKFALFWLGLGVVCTVFMIVFAIYTLIVRPWPT